jgi:uncharacterized membrane protein
MKRYDSIDVLRAGAILSMVQIHFTQNLAERVDGDGLLYYLSGVLGMIPAPLFTFLVGVSLHLSLRSRSGAGRAAGGADLRQVRRGLFLFLAGLLFAVLVRMPDQVFSWDILTLIGASLIVLHSLRHASNGALALATIVIVAVSPPLRDVSGYAAHWPSLHHYVSSLTLGDVLWGFATNGYFPLLPWLVFPLAGLLAARVLFSDDPWGGILQRSLPWVGAACIALAAFGARAGEGSADLRRWYASPVAFYPATTTFILMALGVILLLFWALHRWLDRQPRPAIPALPFLRRYSRYSFTTYVVHHMVLLWPLFLAAGLEKRGDPRHHFGAVVPTWAALTLAGVFVLGFYGVLVIWDRREGRYSFEWLLGRLSS